jgi:hypothetical protein
MTQPKPQPERRGRPALRFNRELADQFGIQPAIDAPDPPRELVQVDHIPTPPDVEQPVAPDRKGNPTSANPEETIEHILREEAEELSVRLSKFGVDFGPAQQQALVDYGMALLTGLVGGGAVGHR